MKKRLKGSITVETTFVMWTTLMVIFFMITLTFILHDCVVIQLDAAMCARRGARYIVEDISLGEGEIDWRQWEEKGLLWRVGKSYEKEAKEIEEDLYNEIKEGLLALTVTEIRVEAKYERVTIFVEAKMKAAVFERFFKAFHIRPFNYRYHITGTCLESEEKLRLFRGINKVFKNEKEGEEK